MEVVDLGDLGMADEVWLHSDVHHHCNLSTKLYTSGLVNFTNFMEGVLLIFSTGFAPGSIHGSTLFVHCSCLYVPVWARYNHGSLVQCLQKSRGGRSASV